MGYGSKAIALLRAFYQGDLQSLDETAMVCDIGQITGESMASQEVCGTARHPEKTHGRPCLWTGRGRTPRPRSQTHASLAAAAGRDTNAAVALSGHFVWPHAVAPQVWL